MNNDRLGKNKDIYICTDDTAEYMEKEKMHMINVMMLMMMTQQNA
jgi:predicted nucleic acid-binding Zn ribbon protein